MIDEFVLTATGCLLLGVMTTMHPCPLAANVAALSFLSGTSGSIRRLISIVIFFSLGYVFSLMGIAVIINLGLISIPRLSVYLQSIFSAFLGPMLILVGMVLAEMIKVGRAFKGFLINKESWANKPVIYVFLMGALLAIAFCPATAFIYFGIMIPLSVDSTQIILFPLLYASGALLPIVTISFLLKHGSIVILKEKWVKKIPLIAGWILILSGIYITLEQLYF